MDNEQLTTTLKEYLKNIAVVCNTQKVYGGLQITATVTVPEEAEECTITFNKLFSRAVFSWSFIHQFGIKACFEKIEDRLKEVYERRNNGNKDNLKIMR